MERDERKEWEWEEALAAKAIAEAKDWKERLVAETIRKTYEKMRGRPLYRTVTVRPKVGKPYIRQIREWNYMATKALINWMWERCGGDTECFTYVFEEEAYGEIEPGMYLENPWEDPKHAPADVQAILEEQFSSQKAHLRPPPAAYDDLALRALREEVQEFGGVIVPKQTYARLQSVQDRLKQLKTELKSAEKQSELTEARLRAQIEESKKEIERLKAPRPRPSYGDAVSSLEEYLKKVKKIRGVY